MNERKNNGRGIFYGVIGVATLVVAIIGATFAYFTATAGDNNTITGNMASITFDLQVSKVTHVDESKGGMIPMSNNMVEAAVTDSNFTDGSFTGAGQTCVDDNGNAVCQIYKIEVNNTGTASLFLDGYISLTGGSGVPTDYTTATNATTMRWAQVFCSGTQTDEITGCSTRGKTTTRATGATSGAASIEGIDTNWAALGSDSDSTGHDSTRILTSNVTNTGYISGNSYDVIDRNYIRVSDHAAGAVYKRETDVTSALVFNQYLDAATGTNHTQTYYFVVWLSETGTNQTAGSDGAGAFENANGLQFFSGNVTFNSAQGSEVTATFTGYTAVPSDQLAE